MKKLLLLLTLLSPLLASAQGTSVTATVTDPNGVVYSNGTWKAFFVNRPGFTGIPLLNGSPFTMVFNGSTDNNGAFSVVLSDLSQISPLGSSWRFIICSASSGTCFESIRTEVIGSSIDLSAQLSAAAPLISGVSFASIRFGSTETALQIWGASGQAAPLAFMKDAKGKLLWQFSTLGITFPDGTFQSTAGGGGAGSVLNVFGRTGSILAASGDYNFNQLAGSLGLSQTPLTTAGDILFVNTTPALARLAVGANGQYLGVSSGLPTYLNFPSSFGAVPSVFGRTGAVVSVSGDYNFNQLAGNIAVSQMNNGTGASTTTFWRGDGTWATAVISFSSGNLSPLFTTSIATPTTTPALSFTLSTTPANTIFGNCTGSTGSPAFCAITWNMISTGTVTSIATFPGGDLFHGGTNAQTGTTYTIVASDENKLLTFNNGSAVAVTLPAATTTGFTSGAVFEIQNLGGGAVNITPTTSTIDGGTSIVLTTNQGVRIFSDGANYNTQRGIGGGGGIPCVTTAFSIQYNASGGFGCISNFTWTAATGVHNFSQLANGNTLLKLKRFTDASPTGNLFVLRDTADTTDLARLDATANYLGASYVANGAGAGYLGLSQGASQTTAACPAGGPNCVVIQADTAVTPYMLTVPGTAASGVLQGSLSGSGATLTNKLASVIPTSPFELPIGVCTSATAAVSAWDTPASGTAGTVACITDGSNVHSKPVLNYANSGTPEWWYTLLMPPNLTGNADMNLVWQTATVSGTATFNLDVICQNPNNTADTTAFSAGNFMAPAQQTASSTANNLNLVTVTNQAWPASCTSGTLAHFRLKRTDTGTAVTASVVTVQLTLRRTF